MSASEPSTKVGAVIRSHIAALALGVFAGLLVRFILAPTAARVMAVSDREPLHRAALFAYAWGSDADASALLDQYAHTLRADHDRAPEPDELSDTELRRALVAYPPAEVREICRSARQSRPECRPDYTKEFVAQIAAGRKTGFQQ